MVGLLLFVVESWIAQHLTKALEHPWRRWSGLADDPSRAEAKVLNIHIFDAEADECEPASPWDWIV